MLGICCGHYLAPAVVYRVYLATRLHATICVIIAVQYVLKELAAFACLKYCINVADKVSFCVV
jgi:hypothetical protein